MRTRPPRAHRSAPWLALIALLGSAASARAQLIPGIEEWAEASIEASTSKWVGQRVAFPIPEARPSGLSCLRSTLSPIALHAPRSMPLERVTEVLRALEAAHELYATTGFVSRFGDGGEGGTADHDFYLVDDVPGGVTARIDATEPVAALDSASAFGLIDLRIPRSLLDTCAAQALADVMLFELDPAEAPSVRASSAALLAELVTGQLGCDDAAEQAAQALGRAPFPTETTSRGAAWLSRITRREDSGSGVFLRDMWQFARQRTWQGEGLRGSPDLLEAIEKALEHRYETLADVAAELSIDALMTQAPGPITEPNDPRKAHLLADVTTAELPEHLRPVEPPLEPLGSAFALVRTPNAKTGDRLRIWSRGEYGVRWALSASRYDDKGQMLSRVRAPARENPNGYLIVELEPRTASVLVSVTHVSDGTPDADAERPADERTVVLILDR